MLWWQIFLKELSADGYSDGLRDQNAVVYLLKTHPEWHSKVAFVDKEVCLNCYWRDLVGVTGFAKPDFERTENVRTFAAPTRTLLACLASVVSCKSRTSTSAHSLLVYSLCLLLPVQSGGMF